MKVSRVIVTWIIRHVIQNICSTRLLPLLALLAQSWAGSPITTLIRSPLSVPQECGAFQALRFVAESCSNYYYSTAQCPALQRTCALINVVPCSEVSVVTEVRRKWVYHSAECLVTRAEVDISGSTCCAGVSFLCSRLGGQSRNVLSTWCQDIHSDSNLETYEAVISLVRLISRRCN